MKRKSIKYSIHERITIHNPATKRLETAELTKYMRY